MHPVSLAERFRTEVEKKVSDIMMQDKQMFTTASDMIIDFHDKVKEQIVKQHEDS